MKKKITLVALVACLLAGSHAYGMKKKELSREEKIDLFEKVRSALQQGMFDEKAAITFLVGDTGILDQEKAKKFVQKFKRKENPEEKRKKAIAKIKKEFIADKIEEADVITNLSGVPEPGTLNPIMPEGQAHKLLEEWKSIKRKNAMKLVDQQIAHYENLQKKDAIKKIKRDFLSGIIKDPADAKYQLAYSKKHLLTKKTIMPLDEAETLVEKWKKEKPDRNIKMEKSPKYAMKTLEEEFPGLNAFFYPSKKEIDEDIRNMTMLELRKTAEKIITDLTPKIYRYEKNMAKKELEIRKKEIKDFKKEVKKTEDKVLEEKLKRLKKEKLKRNLSSKHREMIDKKIAILKFQLAKKDPQPLVKKEKTFPKTRNDKERKKLPRGQKRKMEKEEKEFDKKWYELKWKKENPVELKNIKFELDDDDEFYGQKVQLLEELIEAKEKAAKEEEEYDF